MPKYLFTFEKAESVRWLGHLDILRTFERAIRRARLPIAFSSGFNPRERLAFASALSTGVTGSAEPAILELTDPLSPDELVERLNAALPPGIRTGNFGEIPDAGSRDVLNAFDRAEYTVVCACPPETDDIIVEEAICALMARSEISITREREGRSKTVNIRPFLYQLVYCSDRPAPDRLVLQMTVAIGEAGNAKPAEVVNALAADVSGLTLRRAHRAIVLQSGREIE